MVTQTNVNMIFVGTYSDVDTLEISTLAENAGALIGTYDNLTVTDVTETDVDDNGAIQDDEAQVNPFNPDTLSYDVGFGPETYEIDSSMAFVARVTLGDGSTQDLTVAVLQTTIGDVFIRDASNALDNLNIQSIELLSVQNADYSGSNTGNSIDNTAIVCFVDGTQILTPQGPCAVEDLKVGMRVTTLDGGALPILWLGHQPVHGPCVEIAPDAFGDGLPARRLRVSPQHRLVVNSPIAERMTGKREVLLPAKRFCDAKKVRQRPLTQARYWHLLLDGHAVIKAEGLPVESLYPGKEVFRSLSGQAKTELRRALARAGKPAGLGIALARFEPKGHVQRKLVERHIKNAMPFWSEKLGSPQGAVV